MAGGPLTGEPIGLKRLLLRPTASLCIEAKERQEQREKHLRHTEQ
jgi:DnaK suppressor protein